MRIVPFAAIQFTSHEQYTHYFSIRGEITPIGRFAAGAMAGATGVCDGFAWLILVCDVCGHICAGVCLVFSILYVSFVMYLGICVSSKNKVVGHHLGITWASRT